MSRPTQRDLLIAAAAFVSAPTVAHAYIDPGSAGFIITSVLGALATGGYIVRGYLSRLNRRIFHRDRKAVADGDGSDSKDAGPEDGSARG